MVNCRWTVVDWVGLMVKLADVVHLDPLVPRSTIFPSVPLSRPLVLLRQHFRLQPLQPLHRVVGAAAEVVVQSDVLCIQAS